MTAGPMMTSKDEIEAWNAEARTTSPGRRAKPKIWILRR